MSGFSFTNSRNYTNLSCDYFKNTENMCLFILWIKALFGLMEEEGKKKKKGMTFLCLVRKENKRQEEWEGKRFL